MGCKNCNQQKQNNRVSEDQSNDTKDNSFIENVMHDSDFGDNGFILKIVVFLVLGILLPFILAALLLQLFLHFFLPKSVLKINTGIKNFFKKLGNKYFKFIKVVHENRREKQFAENRGYEEDSELLDIEVHEDMKNNKNMEVN
tara:strand:+ start:304 stop:732 length:429 start_codon:yes stop_codon:yes gene_type:complete